MMNSLPKMRAAVRGNEMSSIIHTKKLFQAVLASTLFISPLVLATQFGGNTVFPEQQTVNNQNLIQVLYNGQIVAGNGKNAVIVNSANSQVITDPFNSFAKNKVGVQDGRYAIFANNTGLNGIVVQQGPAKIAIGDGSGVTVFDGDAIQISNPSTTVINNLGTIQSFEGLPLASILIKTGSGPVTINNAFSGHIIDGSGVTLLVQAGSPGLTFANAGLIQQTGETTADNTIIVKSPFNRIANLNFGRMLNEGDGSGADLSVIVIDTNAVNNDGTLTNAEGALISQNDPLGQGDAISVISGNHSKVISNSGAIINRANRVGGSGAAIHVSDGAALVTLAGVNNTPTGFLFNQQADQGALRVEGTVFGVDIGAGTAFGVVNSGTIMNSKHGIAIDLSQGDVKAGFDQQGGAVIGNVLLAKMDSLGGNGGDQSVFRMSAGSIAGNVVANTAGAGAAIIELTGGDIFGGLLLGDDNSFLNVSGTANIVHIQSGISNNLITLKGGQFHNFTGQGNDQLVFQNAFTFEGGVIDSAVGIATVDVFTQNANIINLGKNTLGLSSIVTAPDSTWILASNVHSAGTFVQVSNNGLLFVPTGTPSIDLVSSTDINATPRMANVGTLSIGNRAVLHLNTDGDPTLSPSFFFFFYSTLQLGVAGVSVDNGPSAGELMIYPQRVTTASTDGNVVFKKGSVIQPMVSGFIPIGQRYNVVYDIAGRTINDGSTIVQPNSAVISFTKQLTGPGVLQNTIQLTTQRNTYTALSDEGTRAVAKALDSMAVLFSAISPDFLPNNPAGNTVPSNSLPNNITPSLLSILAGIDQLATRENVITALDSLQFFNNRGLTTLTFDAMKNIFDSTIARLENFMPRGINAGDRHHSGLWAEVLGAHAQQRDSRSIVRYQSDAQGIALGVDWLLESGALWGVAGSYTHSALQGAHTVVPKDAEINSWQATLYGWLPMTPITYIDVALGVAHNDFDTQRFVLFNNQAVRS